MEIATNGYSYHGFSRSNVAFFPAYPLIGAILAVVPGLLCTDALLIISNFSFYATLVLLQRYFSERSPAGTSIANCACLYVAFLPTTVFCRMAYSESLFLLISVLALYGMHRKWPLVSLALIVGLATAIRPVGVALLLPFAWHLRDESKTLREFLRQAVYLLPLAAWGILDYMLFLYLQFDDPLVFSSTQQYWWVRAPGPFGSRVLSLMTLEPIWSVYDPDSIAYWGRGTIKNPLFSLRFANPIYFLVTVALVGIGAWKRWLNSREILLSAGLLLIPYVLHSYQTLFVAQGRYASVVFPSYLVAGRLLSATPWPVRVVFFAGCGVLLAAYSAAFASWHEII